MRLTAPAYLDLMTHLGRFTEGAAIPDLNTLVWRRYLDLYASHAGPVEDIDIISTGDGFAFYCDPIMGLENWSWALLSPISHPALPFTTVEILAAVPRMRELFTAEDVPLNLLVTDTFVPPAPADGDAHFPWINSPVAQFPDGFTAYTEKLASSRRKQMRRLYRDYADNPDIRFELSARPLDAAELAHIATHTHRRWGEDGPFALAQTLFAMAAADAAPGSARFMRVWKEGTLVFVNSYIVRGDTITSQATCRNEDVPLSGLGTLIDFRTIEFLSAEGSNITTLDPTCMTGADDPGSIATAKREVINTDRRRPIFLLDTDRLLGVTPPRFDGQAWHLPAEPLIIGRSL